MSAERIDVLAVLDDLQCDMEMEHSEDSRQVREILEVRAAVAELIEIQRRLVAWNRNVNGEGSELAQICADAEAVICRTGGGK